MRPPRIVHRPEMRSPSGQQLAFDAERRRDRAAMTASRSLSLTRSSPAPVTRVSPRAAAAAMKNTGNSSIESGTSASGTRMPRKRARAHVNVRDRLGAVGARAARCGCRRPSAAAVRAARCASGLTPTPRSVRPEAAPRQPATMKNAADEKSPGTSMRQPDSRAPPVRLTRTPSRSTSTPKPRNMRSV